MRALRLALRLSAALIVSPLAIKPAFAGGLQAASTGLSTFQVWFYSFLGIGALVYLSWKGAEAFFEKAHWSDFAMGVGKVAVVGASVVLATWAWGLFTS